MEGSGKVGEVGVGGLVWTGRILALIGGGFWMLQGLATAIVNYRGPRVAMMGIAVPGLILLVTAIAAWLWQRPGAILLIVEGVVLPLLIRSNLARVHAKPITMLVVLGSIGLPPLLAGILLLLGRREPQRPAGE